MFLDDDIILSSIDEQTIGDQLPELKLSEDNKDILDLIKKWKEIGEEGQSKMKPRWRENVKFWLGKGDTEGEYSEFHENRIFSGLETFLPILTRQKPEPVVEVERKKEIEKEELEAVNKIVEKVEDRLGNLLDLDKIKLKMKSTGRFWSLYQLGISMVEWDKENDRPTVKILRPDRVLLDTRGTIQDGQYTGEFIGVSKTKTASKLKELFPSAKKAIDEKSENNDGSIIKYVEWWTNDMVVYALEDVILDKIKNPNWNYDEDFETTDEFGEENTETIDGINHFNNPKMPFSFFSVYNIADGVYDKTGIIQQSLPNQKTVNDRIQQIKKNVDNQNNSVGFYGLDETQGTQALQAMRRGDGILFTNKQEQGVERFGGIPLTGDVYNDLANNKQAIDSNFATNAVTRGEDTRDKTVRGKIIAKGSDESRIGFIAEYLEQYADSIYNHIVQLLYVFDDDLKDDLSEFGKKLLISVKEGSMIPKDPITARNEAIDLFNSGAMDILTLYEKLDFDNPKEVATRTVLYSQDPLTYLKNILDFTPEQLQPEVPQEVPQEVPPIAPTIAPPLPPQVPQANNQLPVI